LNYLQNAERKDWVSPCLKGNSLEKRRTTRLFFTTSEMERMTRLSSFCPTDKTIENFLLSLCSGEKIILYQKKVCYNFYVKSCEEWKEKA
jgi:hypothetical protein